MTSPASPPRPIGARRFTMTAMLGLGGLFMAPTAHADDLLLPGACQPGEPALACTSDINGDGLTNVTDLLALLAGWGACP